MISNANCPEKIIYPAVVSGPIGPTGVSGIKGGSGISGPTGPTGAIGEIGPQGVGGFGGGVGDIGERGIIGGSSMLAYFTGANWNPPSPFYDGLGLPCGNFVNFGKVPFVSGEYLFHMALNIRWSGNYGYPDKSCEFSFQQGYGNTLKSFKWAQIKTGLSGHGYGTVQSYAHYFIASVENNKELFVSVISDTGNHQEVPPVLSLEGAITSSQLAVFHKPVYIINSPGFF